MLWFGLLLAVLSIGRAVAGIVLVAALVGGALESSLPVLVTGAAGLAAVAYLGWFAIAGHRQLRGAPVPHTARRIVIGYGIAIFAAVPLVEWAAFRYTT